MGLSEGLPLSWLMIKLSRSNSEDSSGISHLQTHSHKHIVGCISLWFTHSIPKYVAEFPGFGWFLSIKHHESLHQNNVKNNSIQYLLDKKIYLPMKSQDSNQLRWFQTLAFGWWCQICTYSDYLQTWGMIPLDVFSKHMLAANEWFHFIRF